MTGTIGCDVSYFQDAVDDTYSRRWLIFRCCDGDFHDPNCGVNSAWAEKALAEGRIDGWTAYCVYRPGKNAAVFGHMAALPAGGYRMIDAESWAGAIVGDHSVEINQLAHSLLQRNPLHVWGYGNKGDLASIWPSRGTLPVVVADYSAVKPSLPNMVGWQYYGGTPNPVPAGYPTSSAPFGNCDHNELYVTAEHSDSEASKPVLDEGDEDDMYTAYQYQGRIWLAAPGYWANVSADEWDLARKTGQVRGNKAWDVSQARLNQAKSLALKGAK